MIQHLVNNRANFSTKSDRINRAAAEAQARATAAPVFADISRFAEPSATHMIWQPTTTGFHPSFV